MSGNAWTVTVQFFNSDINNQYFRKAVGVHLLLEYYAMAVKPYWTGMYAGDGYLWSRLPAVQTEPVVLLLPGLQGGQGWHVGVARLQHYHYHF